MTCSECPVLSFICFLQKLSFQKVVIAVAKPTSSFQTSCVPQWIASVKTSFIKILQRKTVLAEDAILKPLYSSDMCGTLLKLDKEEKHKNLKLEF